MDILIKEAVKKQLISDEVPYFEEVWKNTVNNSPEIFERGKQNNIDYLDTKILFGPIDKLIEHLTSLKEQGFESISKAKRVFRGDSPYQLNRMIVENDNQYLDRIRRHILHGINDIRKKKKEKLRKLEKIEELKKQITTLEQGL